MSGLFRIEPVVGEWYRANDRTFEVVAIDGDDGTIEIQHADGSLEELDADDWSAWAAAGDLRETDPPDDYVENYDDADDDYGAAAPAERDGPLLSRGALDGLDLFES